MSIAQPLHRGTETHLSRGSAGRGLWMLAGGLTLAHIVMLFGALPLERTPLLGDTAAANAAALITSSMTRSFAGGYIEMLAFLVFLLAASLFTRLVCGDAELPRWLATAARSFATCYVAVTIAVGFPAGAAAIYDGHHGAPLATVVAVNDIRNFAYFLSLAILAAFTVCLCAAGLATRSLPRWLGIAGFVISGLLLVTIPAERSGVMDLASMVWYVWFVALAIVAIRSGRGLSRLDAVPVAV
jgi:hypothetical protein